MRCIEKFEDRIEARLQGCSIAITTALVAAGIAAAAGSTASAAIGAHAAGKAANTQADAATHAADLQRQQFEESQANLAPWREAGKTSLAELMKGLEPGGQFSTPFSGTFKPPTLDEAKMQPGYQFAQKAGEQGILHGSAAAGGAFTTGELANLTQFNQNLGQSAYQQAYNNSADTFTRQFNTYNTNQTNLYNRLAGISNAGEGAGAQIAQLGQNSVTQQGADLTDAARAQAAGTVGQAQAWAGGLGGVTNAITGGLTLSALMGANGSGIDTPTSGIYRYQAPYQAYA